MSKFDRSRKETSGVAPMRVLELEFEPFSEQRWGKIEHGLFARLDAGELTHPRRPARSEHPSALRAGWALGLVTVALAAAVVLGVRSRGPAPSVSRISTGGATSHVVLPGVVLDVSPESAVVVSGNTDESAFIALDHGVVTFQVAHRRPGAPLIVQAGEVSVEVVGTRFRVTRQGESAAVSVQEGLVRVDFRGQTAMVRAGQSWPPAPAAVASVEPPVDSSSALGDPSEAPTSTDGAPRVPHAREAGPKPPREVQKKHAASAESSAVADEPSPSLQSQFELATQLEARDPVAAIRLYEGLESSPSSWAANALFAHGRLEAARGNRAIARSILTQYLTRFPNGTNVPDARLLIARLE